MDTSAFAQGNGSQFFKFILEDTLCLGKLMIPRDFSAKYGDSLPSVVTLELPSGARWKVELLKNSAREIWFDKGFKEFAQHCSLGHGHVLVFRYDKKSLFHVQVFQGSGLEIGYPDKPAVEVKMEQDEDYQRYMFDTSSENGVARAPNVKMEHNEGDFQRAPKFYNEKAREGVVKMENSDNDSHRVKKASKGTMGKDGAEVNAETVLRRSGRLRAEGGSKLNYGRTTEESGDKTESDGDDWDDDDVDVDVESIDDDSEDEDYVDIMMDDDDEDDEVNDRDYAQLMQQKSRRKKPDRATKPNNGRASGSRNGRRGEMDEEWVGKQGEGRSMGDVDEDVDEDYMGFLDATFG